MDPISLLSYVNALLREWGLMGALQTVGIIVIAFAFFRALKDIAGK